MSTEPIPIKPGPIEKTNGSKEPPKPGQQPKIKNLVGSIQRLWGRSVNNGKALVKIVQKFLERNFKKIEDNVWLRLIIPSLGLLIAAFVGAWVDDWWDARKERSKEPKVEIIGDIWIDDDATDKRTNELYAALYQHHNKYDTIRTIVERESGGDRVHIKVKWDDYIIHENEDLQLVSGATTIPHII